MNKKEFVIELSKQLSYPEDKCIIINEILENNFFISKKNKEKIVCEFIKKLDIDIEEANKIYDISLNIIKVEIKEKFKHPFKSKD